MHCSALYRLGPPQRQVPKINCASAPAARVTAVLRLQCASSRDKSVEGVLSKLQSLSTAASGLPKRKQQAAQGADASLKRLLATASSAQGDMSVGQLCRFTFILTRLHDSSANIKPLWQAVWRRLLQLSTSAAQHKHQGQPPNIPANTTSHDISTISDNVAGGAHTTASHSIPNAPVPHSQLLALLQSQASAGDVLYLLRALAAWQDNEVPAYASHGPGDGQEAGSLHATAAVVAAASQKANTMALKELLLAVAALAQLNYFDAHIMATASTAFVEAVAAAGSTPDVLPATSTGSSSSSSSQVSRFQPQHQQQEVLPHIKDHQLVVNYLWANASLGYADPLLLRAVLQLLLVRRLASSISRSHLPLCMWALAALLVCQLHRQQQQQQQMQGKLYADGLHQRQQQLQQVCDQQQQQQQQLVQTVAAVHGMLAAQAHQLWHASTADAADPASAQSNSLQSGDAGMQQGQAAPATGDKGSKRSSGRKAKHKGSGPFIQHKSAFSLDSRRQMYQSYVWLEAAAAAPIAAAAAVDSIAVNPMPAQQPASADGLRWPLTRLLAEVQQQQQQQQPATAALADFWQYCGEAWSGSTTRVSGLQREVFQALQHASLHPIMECAAQPVQHLSDSQVNSTRQQQQQHEQQHCGCSSTKVAQQPRQADTAVDSSEVSDVNEQPGRLHTGDIAPGFLSVDIACIMPAHVLRHAQQQGLKAAIAQLQEQHNPDEILEKADNISSSSSNRNSSSSSSTSHEEGVLVAVEVDGPTHVAVNCADYQVGATVCRNWLLQQWGWEVLVLPWWQWQDKQHL